MEKMEKKVSAQNRREERSRSKRQRIIDAAIRIFSEKGYQNADVLSIAEACSVGKGTIYLYFKGKEDLFWATGIHIGEKVTEILDQAKELKSEPNKKLAFFLDKFAEFINDHLDYIAIINQIRSVPKEKTPEPINRMKQLCLDGFLCGLFEQAMEEGTIPKDAPKNYTISVINSIWGIIAFYHQEDDTMSLPDRVRKTWQFFWNGIKKKEGDQ